MTLATQWSLAKNAMAACDGHPARTRGELRDVCRDYIKKNGGTDADLEELEELLKIYH